MALSDKKSLYLIFILRISLHSLPPVSLILPNFSHGHNFFLSILIYPSIELSMFSFPPKLPSLSVYLVIHLSTCPCFPFPRYVLYFVCLFIQLFLFSFLRRLSILFKTALGIFFFFFFPWKVSSCRVVGSVSVVAGSDIYRHRHITSLLVCPRASASEERETDRLAETN